MKELIASSSNILAVLTADRRMQPMAEVVLMVAEPEYSLDSSGNVVSNRKFAELRFVASLPSLSKLAVALVDIAKQARLEVHAAVAAKATAAKPEESEKE